MESVKRINNIIRASLREKSLNKLNEYLASLENSEDFLDLELILILTKVLKTSGKFEKKTLDVACVLNCLQHFSNTVQDGHKWEKISEDLSKLCDLVFVISSNYIKDECLIQQAVTMISAFVEGVKSLSDDLLRFMMKTLLQCSLSKTFSNNTRLHIMILIGSLLQKSSRRIRTEILPSTIDYMKDLSNTLTDCDDYETQVSIVEILARSLIFIHEKNQKALFSRNPKINEMYKQFHPFLNFDPDCRQFLNKVNESLGNEQKVFSVPCMVVSADDNRLRRPNDPAYIHFWVDFNLGSRSVSFYYQPNSSECWELMTVPEDKVLYATAKDSSCKSRSGETFDAVKIEFTIESTDLSPNTELPQNLKIYSEKEKYMNIEHVVMQIFNTKYKNEVVYNKKDGERIPSKTHEEVARTSQEKSLFEETFQSKFSHDENNEDGKNHHQSKDPMQSFDDKSGKEESEQESNSLKFMKRKIMEEVKTGCLQNLSQDIQCNKTKNYGVSQERDKSNEIESLPQITTSDKFVKSFDALLDIPNKCIETQKVEDEKRSPKDTHVKNNTSGSNSNSKKRRLYSFEKSNAENIFMSSQDQVLSVEIPSYKIAKKETIIERKPNPDRKNISYSYINNTEKIKSKNNLKKQFNFEEGMEDHGFDLSDDNKMGSDSDSSPHALFKDLKAMPKPSLVFSPSNKKFFSSKSKDADKPKRIYTKSVYSDFSSSDKKNLKKYSKTSNRSKQQKPLKRLKSIQFGSSSSDSDSQYIPPSTKLNENNEEVSKKSPINTRFARRMVIDKVDPTRDDCCENDMEMQITHDLDEPKMKAEPIAPLQPISHGKAESKLSVKTGPGKKKNTGKMKEIKSAGSKRKINSEPKCLKEDILEKLSENLIGCLDNIEYATDGLFQEDMALDILASYDDQLKTLIKKSTFKADDLLKFGRIIIKQVYKKVNKPDTLSQMERENFTTLDYKLQTSFNRLCGSNKKNETFVDKFEKLNSMFEATYKLHKEMASEIKSGLVNEIVMPSTKTNPIKNDTID